MRRVGVIGLGRMGLPMARHLVRAGFTVSGYDRDPQHSAALGDAGGLPLP
ncbi:MAG: NAD(P)-binding domain-containing protein, partial [Armatimonadetes bacterium]|nr:NAD(P)-binding domain-containing protein [Armatimonadota bacterium]